MEEWQIEAIAGRLSRNYTFINERVGFQWVDDGTVQQQDIAMLLAEVRRLRAERTS